MQLRDSGNVPGGMKGRRRHYHGQQSIFLSVQHALMFLRATAYGVSIYIAISADNAVLSPRRPETPHPGRQYVGESSVARSLSTASRADRRGRRTLTRSTPRFCFPAHFERLMVRMCMRELCDRCQSNSNSRGANT